MRFAAEVLTPRAVEVDRTEVPRARISTACGEIGYHRLFVPEQYGGSKLPPRVVKCGEQSAVRRGPVDGE